MIASVSGDLDLAASASGGEAVRDVALEVGRVADGRAVVSRSEFLYVTSRTRGSPGEQLTEEQKLRGSIWSQRNLYRDVVEPAREAAGIAFTLYDARHTFVSTLMAAGIPVPEVAAYSGHAVGELAAVAAGDGRLRSQTTLAVYTHATGEARELALAAIDDYLQRMLKVAPRLRAALAS